MHSSPTYHRSRPGGRTARFATFGVALAIAVASTLGARGDAVAAIIQESSIAGLHKAIRSGQARESASASRCCTAIGGKSR